MKIVVSTMGVCAIQTFTFVMHIMELAGVLVSILVKVRHDRLLIIQEHTTVKITRKYP